MFWNGRTAIDGLSGSDKAGRVSCGCRHQAHPIDSNRPRDVLKLLLADILEGDVELAVRVLLDPADTQMPPGSPSPPAAPRH